MINEWDEIAVIIWVWIAVVLFFTGPGLFLATLFWLIGYVLGLSPSFFHLSVFFVGINITLAGYHALSDYFKFYKGK